MRTFTMESINDPPSNATVTSSPAAQLTALRRENERLQALLIAAQPVPGLSLARLQRLQLAAAASGGSVDARDLKIVELARQVRQLTVAEQKHRAATAAAAAAAASNPVSDAKSSVDGAPQTTTARPTAFGSALPTTAVRRGSGSGGDGENIAVSPEREHAQQLAALRSSLEKVQRERERCGTELRAARRALIAEVGCDGVTLSAILASFGAPTIASTVASSRVAEGGSDGVNVRALGAATEAPITVQSAETGEAEDDCNVAAGIMANSASPANAETADTSSSSTNPSQPVVVTPAAVAVLSTANAATPAVKPGDWRGRAQTITLLKARVRVLEKANAALTLQRSQYSGAAAGLGSEVGCNSELLNRDSASTAAADVVSNSHSVISQSPGPTVSSSVQELRQDNTTNDDAGAQLPTAAAALAPHHRQQAVTASQSSASTHALGTSHSSTEPPFNTTASTFLDGRHSVIDRAERDVAAAAAVRHGREDAVAFTLSSAVAEAANARQKAAAMRARLRMLEEELRGERGRVGLLVDAAAASDALVDALQEKVRIIVPATFSGCMKE